MNDRGLYLVYMVLTTIIISSLMRASECSRYHSEIGIKNSRHRHRHRHEAPSGVASSRRVNEALEASRRGPWLQQEDYDYDGALDVDDDDEEEDDDYEQRVSYDRNYQPSRNTQRNYHTRFENRYPSRYHQISHPKHLFYRFGANVGGSSSSSSISSNSRGYRQRPDRERAQDRRRNHDFDDHNDKDDDDFNRDLIYERSNSRRWWTDNDSVDDRGITRWRNFRKHRPIDHYDIDDSKNHRERSENRRNDWKSRNTNPTSSGNGNFGQRNEDDDWVEKIRKFNHRKRPVRPTNDFDNRDDESGVRNDARGIWNSKKSRNMIDHVLNSGGDKKKDNDLEDSDDDDDDDDYDDVTDGGDSRKINPNTDDEEEDSIWKDNENYDIDDDDHDDDGDDDNDDDDDQNFDNTNYYKTEDEPPYKTFDEIIKSLTSDDPITPKSSTRREYRNTGIERYLRRDVYGNIYDSRNSSIRSVNDGGNYGKSINLTNSGDNKWRMINNKSDITSYSSVRDKKISNAIADNVNWKNNRENDRKKGRVTLDEEITKTKSLEIDEDDEDWDNNDKDEDVVKVHGDHSKEMQADVTTNTEYADEENETETEDETSAPIATSSPTPTTSKTTTTTTETPTTTTTTTKPTVKPIFITTSTSRVSQERRDSRSYETSSAPQSNSLQTVSHKWQSLSTRDGVKDSKPQTNNKNGKAADMKEAMQHAIKVSREGSCQWPKARVIPVREVYPSPSTTYIPHCAILHRCSDDTGCCRSESLTCVPKISHRVELYFYTTSVGGSSVVEKLSFYNHTECECKERTVLAGTTSEKINTRHHSTPVPPPQNIRRPPQRKPCKCPSEFTPRITPEGDCQCNCYDNDQSCIRTRRGKGYFSISDRLCIQNDECATPLCEFGEYMRRQGKCPRKKDRFNALANNYPSNIHHNLRS